jgi:hypothetical protein
LAVKTDTIKGQKITRARLGEGLQALAAGTYGTSLYYEGGSTTDGQPLLDKALTMFREALKASPKQPKSYAWRLLFAETVLLKRPPSKALLAEALEVLTPLEQAIRARELGKLRELTNRDLRRASKLFGDITKTLKK